MSKKRAVVEQTRTEIASREDKWSGDPRLTRAEHIENLKIAHVAMSRPTHLLAFACRNDSIAGHEDALTKNGWQICKVKR